MQVTWKTIVFTTATGKSILSCAKSSKPPVLFVGYRATFALVRFVSSMDKYVTRKVLADEKKKEDADGSSSPIRTPPSPQKRMSSHDSKWLEQFQADKAKYLKMPLPDKRKIYKCRKFFELEDIPTWEEFFLANEEKLRRRLRGRKTTVKADVNESFNRKLALWKGDITALEIDSIANAANSSLLGGGGVDGAIHSSAGSTLVTECRTLQGCDTGDAKITGGYKLPAKYVIHTVGPIGEQPPALKSCYLRCLEVMVENKLKSIAFPCISTGIYGYPSTKAAEVVISTMRKWLETNNNADKVDRIIFCLFMPQDVALYEELMQLYFPVPRNNDVDHVHSDDEVTTNSTCVTRKALKDTENVSKNGEGDSFKHSKENSADVQNTSSNGGSTCTTADAEPAAKRKPPIVLQKKVKDEGSEIKEDCSNTDSAVDENSSDDKESKQSPMDCTDSSDNKRIDVGAGKTKL